MSYAIWITGLPGSGKSTIAKELAKLTNAEILRLDIIRKKLAPKATYSDNERESVYNALAYMGYTLTKDNRDVIFDATDNLNIGRKLARKLIKDFFVVQLKCPLDICIEREEKRKDRAGMKDLYERAKKGEIKLPGLGAKYIEEKDPFLTIETDKIEPKLAAKLIFSKIKKI